MLALLLLVGIAAGEALGWPFLIAPLQRLLSTQLERQVSLAPEPPAASGSGSGATLRFIGGLKLQTPRLEIAAPAWSAAPRLLLAEDVKLVLRYGDLWRAWRGAPLHIARLEAATLDAVLERDAEGRVSWQMRRQPPPADAVTPQMALPSFGQLRLSAGQLRHVDALLAIDGRYTLSLLDAAPTPQLAASAVASAVASQASAAGSVLQINGRGNFRQKPFTLDLRAAGLMPWASEQTAGAALPLRLQARVGDAALNFDGSAIDLLQLRGLSGQFRLSGPSLAAVGDPLGVTLPSTAPFRAHGGIVRQGSTWLVHVDAATVGASLLGGDFSYDTARRRPLLAGRLVGKRLLLADLGPVVGTTAAVSAAKLATPAASAASAVSAAPAAQATPAASAMPPAPAGPTAPTAPAAQAAVLAKPLPLPASTRGPGKLLPNRPFDLAALRVMDANVLIDLRELDLNTARLEPLRPVRAHLVLEGGLLRLQNLDARAAQGRLRGELQLDGRGSTALWTTQLHWDEVRLERWIHPPAAGAVPAYVTGRLKGQARLAGEGRSTAEILASLSGQLRTELQGGAVSHLAVEAAGLDLAQALGLLIKGDDMLPVHCGLADLVAERGVLRPRLMVIDTSDSVIWVDGTLSLANEEMDLRAVVSPKDFSPLALRSPLQVQGSLAQPRLTVAKGPMARKLAAATLLALINPLAALIPLIDTGEARSEAQAGRGCQALLARRPAADPANR